MTDLSLVPVEELVEELRNRHEEFLAVGTRFVENNTFEAYTTHKCASLEDAIWLSKYMKKRIIKDFVNG